MPAAPPCNYNLQPVPNVEMGELNCETFERADGAEQLDFTLSAGQVCVCSS